MSQHLMVSGEDQSRQHGAAWLDGLQESGKIGGPKVLRPVVLGAVWHRLAAQPMAQEDNV